MNFKISTLKIISTVFVRIYVFTTVFVRFSYGFRTVFVRPEMSLLWGAFRLSNTLGMLHKPYRIKKRQRCPLNFTELKSVKDASSSAWPRLNLIRYGWAGIFDACKFCKVHTGTDELASLTLFHSVKFRGHLWRFLILYALWGSLNVFDSLVKMCQDGRRTCLCLLSSASLG